MSSSSPSSSLARRMILIVAVFVVVSSRHCCHAFQTSSYRCSSGITKLWRTSPSHPSSSSSSSLLQISAMTMSNSAGTVGNLHGQSSCFLPLLQNDEDYIAPRIVQIAGAYPGVDIQTYMAVSSDPSAILGQWNYDFSDPDGPQMGTVALPGMTSVYETEDPVVIIADHISLGVNLPPAITEPVDLIVLCDRARTNFAERRFLVLEIQDTTTTPGMLTIAAFGSKEELPMNANIVGHVTLVQIPWLPNMQKKKSGFMEEDELF